MENEVRKYLDAHAARTMSVLEPVELVITDAVDTELTVPLFPKNKEKGSRKIKFSSRIYVERSDIKLQDEKGFYGIAPKKIVGLKYAQTVYIEDLKVENGVVVQVIGRLDETKTKPNSYLNWISVDESFDCEVRNYGLLFNGERPADDDNYLTTLNTKSE